MINNLQFYGIAVLVGFIISLAVRKDDEVPKWNVWTVILFPVCWALIGITMIITVGDGRIQGIKDILFYFDAETLLGSDGYRKGQLLVMLIFPIYFTLVFGLFWRLKNKHIKSLQTTSASRRV